MKTKLSPSMLSIDFGKVAEQLKLVEDAGYPSGCDGWDFCSQYFLWDSCD